MTDHYEVPRVVHKQADEVLTIVQFIALGGYNVRLSLISGHATLLAVGRTHADRSSS